MPRDCQHTAPYPVETCRLCYRLALPDERGESIRRDSGEPAPDADTARRALLARPEWEQRIARAAAAAPPAPGLLRQAANLAGAVARHVARGLPLATEELKAARLAVCRGSPGKPPCDRLTAADRCAECGCHLEVKAGWADQACPLKRWPGETPA